MPKNLPKSNFYLASIDKINSLPEKTANRVINACSAIEEYPINLLYELGRVRGEEINTVEDREDRYFVSGEGKLKTVAAMHGYLYKIVNEAMESLRKVNLN